MKAIYQSKNGNTFTDPLEALYEDAAISAFTMYDDSGAITADLNECIYVFIENARGIDDFNKFREDWRLWRNSAKDGEVKEGFSMWNEYEGYWSDPISRHTFLAIAENVLPG